MLWIYWIRPAGLCQPLPWDMILSFGAPQWMTIVPFILSLLFYIRLWTWKFIQQFHFFIWKYYKTENKMEENTGISMIISFYIEFCNKKNLFSEFVKRAACATSICYSLNIRGNCCRISLNHTMLRTFIPLIPRSSHITTEKVTRKHRSDNNAYARFCLFFCCCSMPYTVREARAFVFYSWNWLCEHISSPMHQI